MKIASVLLAFTLVLAAQQPSPADQVAALQRYHSAAPDNGGILMELASALLAVGNPAGAAKALSEAIDRGVDPDDAALKPFRAFDRQPEVAAALRKAASARQTTSTSEVAFRVAGADLIPEGLAYDPVDHAIFVSSINKRKIVRVEMPRADARHAAREQAPLLTGRDFSKPQDGLFAALGMKVDAKRRELWACTYAAAGTGADRGKSSVARYDLRTGKLVRRYDQDNKDGRHLFNDLVVLSTGDVYLTDSDAGAVYRISAKTDRLEIFAAPGSIPGPNGIALSADERLLYVADYLHGISIFDLVRGGRRPLAHAPNVNIAGIDGLYFHRNTLVAVQNWSGTPRIIALALAPSLDRVQSQRVLESRHPLFDIPTTGTLVGNDFYYIANSQLPAIDDDGRIVDGYPLKDVVILRTPLR